MDVISLNQRFIYDLIESYKSQPALWKTDSMEYRNNVLKTQAYEILVKKCSEYVPGADRHFVRMKINSMRTSFRKEYKKVLNSMKTARNSNEIYKPHLWYYDLLKFLTGEKDDSVNENETNNGESKDSFDSDLSNSAEAESEVKRERSFSPESPIVQEVLLDPLEDGTSSMRARSPKRPRLEEPCVQLVNVTSTAPSKTEDVFDAIGKNVAHKLRGMIAQQRIIAEKIISDVMYHGQMETLTANSRLLIE